MNFIKVKELSFIISFGLINIGFHGMAAAELCGNEQKQALESNKQQQHLLREPVYGVTLDSVSRLQDIVNSLSSLPRKPTTRIVFDEFVPPQDYRRAVNQIGQVSYIMGEILDSSAMNQYSWQEYKNRVIRYLKFFGPKIQIWEIGNEVNGEWLGDPDQVVRKIKTAYKLVKSYGGKTALTLYYNQDCWMYPWEEMFQWAETMLPAYMKKGLDYVLISYYENDCNNLRPDWQKVFNRLGRIFPNSKLGFGEVGTEINSEKADYLRYYYTLPIKHPRYIGGYFWWYFKQDMVPKTKPLWSALSETMKSY